ncbi:hypothetical protein [Lacinutrix chionoecetis]
MNKADFITVIKTPQHITKSQTEDLKHVVDTFPYFQSARALYLKGLKNTESYNYNNALKTTAAYTTDRSILFDFITSKTFVQNEISQFIKHNTAHLLDIEVEAEDISIKKSVTIDAALKQQIEDTKDTLNPELFQPKIEKHQLANFKTETDVETNVAPSEEKLNAPERILNIGKPLEFDKNETHSFNEWLSLTRFSPIQRDTEPEKGTTATEPEQAFENELTKAKKFELIEKFIEKSPKLAAKKAASSKHNIAKAQMIQPEALMTETLARIYVEQKNYKKAIQSYKILSLKYPEKSGFFADQIKAVKELQEQNNKE